MATGPRSARTKRVNRSDPAEIVLPDLSVPPRVRRSPSTSMATASALAGGPSSSAASIPVPSAVPNPSTSSTLAANASTSVTTSSDPAAPSHPDSTSNPPVSSSQPSDPLPARPLLGNFFGPHHKDRQHYERYNKMDKKLISIGAIVENDCVAIESLIDHFRHQEWDKFIQWKGIGHPYVMKCFYANISSENYSFPLKSYFTKDIVIDTDTISRIFNIPNSGIDVFDKTLRDFDGYIDGDTYESAVAMIFKEGESDLDSPAPQQMKLLPQCLARIISLNIAPTLSRSTIYKWTPVLVYCVLKKIRVNLPRLMIQTMYYCVQQPKVCLPFGKVITKLFELEKISLADFPTMDPRPPFHKKNLGQMQYSGYSLPLTLDTAPSSVKKKGQTRATSSSQPEASAEQVAAEQQEVPTQQETAVQQEDPLAEQIGDISTPSLPSLSSLPEDASISLPNEASIPSSPPPTLSETQPLSETSTIPVEPLVTQTENPPSPPTTKNLTQSQSQPIDPDQPIIEDDVDDDGTYQYSPLRDVDLTPSPPHTSQPSTTIPPPTFSTPQPFAIPPSARLACVPPKPTFYFEEDTSMSYDHRWLAHFSKECYYNSVNAMIANSNARAWETYHMLQTGFQFLNPSIRLPPPTMNPFVPIPTPSPAMKSHHLICLQKKSDAIRQKKAAAILSSLRPPIPTSTTFAQTTFTAPTTSIPIVTTKPIPSTSSFAPVSLPSAFTSLSQGLGLRPPTPSVMLSPIDIPIRASPEVTLMSEIFNEKSSFDFSKFASLSTSPPQTSSSATPTQTAPAPSSTQPAPSQVQPAASSVPMDTPPAQIQSSPTEAHPTASEAPTSTTSLPETTPTTLAPESSPVQDSTSVPAAAPRQEIQPETAPASSQAPVIQLSSIPSADDSPEQPLRWKRTKVVSSNPSRSAKRQKKLTVAPPPLSEEVHLPPSPSSRSSSPPVPIPFSVEHPTTDELCNFIMSQKKKK